MHSIAHLLREIGRGRDGAKALDRAQATEMMRAILDGAVSDLELGAALMALRMKGETAVEIAGFLDALAAHTQCVPFDAPCVVIPTYNGARLLPNLVPLLALALARAGVPVLLHGQASEPHGVRSAKTKLAGRVTTLDVLAALDVEPSASIAQAAEHLAQRRLAYLALETVAPRLSWLIALRRMLGVRNVAHTLAKLLRPVAAPSLLLYSYTHAEFGAMLAELFALTETTALAQRGTEGEAVINPQRPQSIDVWRAGQHAHTAESIAADNVALPALDAAATARWTRDVLDGRAAMPASLAAQVEIIRGEVAR